MQFDSFTFVVFFAAVLGVYNALRGWSARKWFLLIASWVFYAAWNPLFLPLLIGSATLDYWVAQRIHVAAGAVRKRWIVLTLVANLGVLGIFKYHAFLLDNLAALLALIGVRYVPAPMDIILPIGISFYTFHSLSYCLDIYRGKFTPTRNWRDYALYVAFFPQLVAGPITRFTQMREQIENPRQTTRDGLAWGCALLVLGLFEKCVLADTVFAPVADGFFNAVDGATAATAWSGTLAFSGQIFCDFAGYSTCAIGAALALGFVLPTNFRYPYAAIGFSDFWRRWHISLSTWLRDYLYVSLGGNRRGEWRTYVNLMLTMLIGGLWHGAAWTFVIWGGLHGLYLAVERLARERLWPKDVVAPAMLRFAYGLLTLLLVSLAWIWFRAADAGTAWQATTRLAAASTAGPSTEQWLALVAFAVVTAVHWLMRERDLKSVSERIPAPLLGALLGAMLALIVLSPGDNHAFIYFQF
ncbi:MAG: MBOAT family protein [Xanthomonadales bacterium PRO7]|nr:MBOAT family protein [Xanthomonadales bacterium PRO7]